MDGSSPRPTPRSERQVPFLAIEAQVGARVQLVVPRFGGGTSYGSAVIGWVEGDYLIVRRPLEGGLGVQLQAGETLVLRLFTGTDVAEFHSTVQRAFNAPLNYLHVDYPAQVRTWRLRSEPRQPVLLAAEAEPAGQNRKVAVRVADLSTGGARLLSPTPLGGRGQALTLTLTITQPPAAAPEPAPAAAAGGADATPSAPAPAAAPPLVLAAQIRSERADGSDPQGSCSCGIQFEKPGAEALATLRALIEASEVGRGNGAQPAG